MIFRGGGGGVQNPCPPSSGSALECFVYTNAVFENEIWGSLNTNFKVYIDDIFANIPKMVFTHYNFYLDKVN